MGPEPVSEGPGPVLETSRLVSVVPRLALEGPGSVSNDPRPEDPGTGSESRKLFSDRGSWIGSERALNRS